jgi:hypothetical protein
LNREFEQIFRQNVVQSRLFYNFMFATRILNTISMSPESRPPLLQGAATHLLWFCFDLQVDRALYALRESVKASPEMTFRSSTTRFWLVFRRDYYVRVATVLRRWNWDSFRTSLPTMGDSSQVWRLQCSS